MCDHTEYVCGRWKTSIDDWSGEESEEWIDSYQRETIEDVDTHRYKCTKCEKIFYYSGRAREYYEEGKTEHSGMLGLDIDYGKKL